MYYIVCYGRPGSGNQIVCRRWDFSKYFRAQYLKNTRLWAACYRVGAVINTNNYVDSFHSVFKTHYLFGKKNNRVDKCLHSVLKYSRDLLFKRTRKVAKCTMTANAKRLIAGHADALQLHCQEVGDGQFFVQSVTNSDVSYLIQPAKHECEIECEVRCHECNICTHQYTCDCIQYLINGSICKHIHCVGIALQKPQRANVSIGKIVEIVEFLHMVQTENLQGKRPKREDLIERLEFLSYQAKDFSLILNEDEEHEALYLTEKLQAISSKFGEKSKEPTNKSAERQRFFKLRRRGRLLNLR